MVFLVSLSMVAGGVLKFRAFPELDGDVVEARLLLPQGTPLARTEAAVEQLTAALARVDAAFTPRQPEGRALVRNVMVRFNTNADAFESGAHLATVTADLLSAEVRDARLDDVLNLWREETGEIADAVSVTFKEPQIGPAGQPIEIRLQGESLDELKASSEALVAWLGRYRGVVDLSDDLRPGKPELRLKLREGATGLGLDAATVAGQLRAAYFGRTAAELQVGPESFDIDVRLPAGDQDSLADLDYFAITLPDGAQVPLSTVAEIETGRGFARVARIDGRRTVTIRGDLDTRVANLNEVLADTRARFLPELARRFPGIEVSLEGETAEQEETGASLRRGLLAGLIGIFLLLSFQFRSYVEPVIVMLTIPLAFLGVIWGHVVMGYNISMPSLVGAASLAGIVVNNAILLVGVIKSRRADGQSASEAAGEAVRARFRPIFVSVTTTIMGMTPLLFESSTQAQTLKPLVIAVVFGLLAATILILVGLPAFYAALEDIRGTRRTDRSGGNSATRDATLPPG